MTSSHNLSKGNITFRGINREYLISDRNIGRPAPKFFISYFNGRVWISDEVPEEFRAPMVHHELAEFEIYKELPNSCLTALISELKTVPNDKLKEYVSFRRNVFTELRGYLEIHNSNSSFLEEIGKSEELLVDLEKVLK